MVLVIDTFKLIKGVGKSIGIYNLTKSIVTKLGAENVRRGMPEKIVILGNEFNRSDMDVEGVEFYQVPGDPKSRVKILLWELFGVRKEAARFQADRILFPRGFRPLVYRGQDTIIIHDLIPFYYDKHYPGYFNRLENAYIMNRLKASIRGAQRVITISDASRKEITELVPGSEGKIREIYNGINDMTAYEKKASAQKREGNPEGIRRLRRDVPGEGSCAHAAPDHRNRLLRGRGTVSGRKRSTERPGYQMLVLC